MEHHLGGSNPVTIHLVLFFFPFTTSLHAMDLVYIPKCSPFNMLSNGMFYLPIHAFVNELQIEMYLIVTSICPLSKYLSSTRC